MLEERIVIEPLSLFLTTNERNDAAREIHRKALIVNDNLRTVRILHCLHACECLAEGSNLCAGIIEAMTDGLQLALCHEWFVTLHIDDDIPVATNLLDGFLDAVGSTLVVGACHHRLAAKTDDGIIDALVVCGNICLFQGSSYFLINVLDDRFATQHSQWLARKTCGSVAGWNDSDKLHFYCLLLFIILIHRRDSGSC